MRKQTRPAEPEIFINNSEKWNQQWVELLNRNQQASFSWYKADGKSAREWALPVLREMNQGHCCFCDGYPLEGMSNEPIEHFQPKSKFPYFAFTWSNLYYCCEKCQSSKADKWDDLLIRPDDVNYEFSRYFEFDLTTGEILPKGTATEQVKKAAETTIKIYGLNQFGRPGRRRNSILEWQKQNDERKIDKWAYRDFLELNPTS